jgi:hypothetical protein
VRQQNILVTQRRFLVVANIRTGSTWLGTSLGRLNGVRFDGEIVWSPQRSWKDDTHLGVPDDYPDCDAALAAVAGPEPVVGAKLLLSPERPLAPDEIEALVARVNRDIIVVHLTRGYLPILLSWRARGGLNLPDPGAVSLGREPTRLERALTRLGEQWGGVDLAAQARNPYGPALDEPRDVVEKLLVLFSNDLVGCRLAARAYQSFCVDYRRLRQRLPALASAVAGQGADRQAVDILDRPTTLKLPAPADRDLPRHALVAEIANRLREEVRSRRDVFGAFRWDPVRREARVAVPGLGALLRRLTASWHSSPLRIEAGSRTAIWHFR